MIPSVRSTVTQTIKRVKCIAKLNKINRSSWFLHCCQRFTSFLCPMFYPPSMHPPVDKHSMPQPVREIWSRNENDRFVLVGYVWSFDSTLTDVSSRMNFTSIHGADYSPSSITGYGASLSLNASHSQFLSMKSPFLDLSNSSWTFEMWIYARSISYTSDNPLVGQCQSKTSRRCLHLVIRSGKPYFGFYNDDVAGQQSLLALRWYHLAFVFDCNTRNQSIYIDGFLDNSRQSNNTYQGNQGNLTVGFPEVHSGARNDSYDGLIDQLSLIGRTRTADEILRDATLTAHFSFDNGSTVDQGPLKLDGSRRGSTNFTTRRVGDALQINNVSDSFFQVNGLVLLGRSNQSYSLAIWIQPSSHQSSTIIHVSSNSTGRGWCIPMLTLTSSGQLRAMSYSGSPVPISGPIISVNQWSHVAVTYSLDDTLRLYVNGTLNNSSLSFSYVGSNSTNYLFLGSSLAGTSKCCAPLNSDGQFTGVVDELRVYSRALTPREVLDLATHWLLFESEDETEYFVLLWQEVLFIKLLYLMKKGVDDDSMHGRGEACWFSVAWAKMRGIVGIVLVCGLIGQRAWLKEKSKQKWNIATVRPSDQFQECDLISCSWRDETKLQPNYWCVVKWTVTGFSQVLKLHGDESIWKDCGKPATESSSVFDGANSIFRFRSVW